MATVEKDIKEANDKIAEVKAIVKKRAKAIKEIEYKEEELSTGTPRKELTFSYPERTIRLGTLFSGIGAIEHAFQRLGLNFEVAFASDIDAKCKQSYFANYDITEENWFTDVREFNAKPYKGKVDIIVGGAPCQAFFMVGRRLGFEDALVFNYGKLKDEQPKTPKPTKKEAEYNRARVGQGKYRELLLEECIYCPITMINDERLLVASHIKPWAVSSDKEKIDPKNGFILSPLYDKLFDKGLITFTDDKRMVISNWISPSNVRRMNLENMKYYPKMPIDDMRIKYLEYHRSCVFKG